MRLTLEPMELNKCNWSACIFLKELRAFKNPEELSDRGEQFNYSSSHHASNKNPISKVALIDLGLAFFVLKKKMKNALFLPPPFEL